MKNYLLIFFACFLIVGCTKSTTTPKDTSNPEPTTDASMKTYDLKDITFKAPSFWIVKEFDDGYSFKNNSPSLIVTSIFYEGLSNYSENEIKSILNAMHKGVIETSENFKEKSRNTIILDDNLSILQINYTSDFNLKKYEHSDNYFSWNDLIYSFTFTEESAISDKPTFNKIIESISLNSSITEISQTDFFQLHRLSFQCKY